MLRRRLRPARRLEWYPPFRAMRVRVLEISEDWNQVRLLLPLADNRNPGGGMFGGAMACLADPIAALVCNRVFPGHQVWTRELTLDFTHESRTDMQLKFALAAGVEAQIRDQLVERGRATPTFEYAYFDTHGLACVKVRCRVAIRPHDYRPATTHHRSRKNQ